MRAVVCLLLLSLLCACSGASASAGSVVDWSSLNATSIASVAAADFLTLTAEQFATIPLGACEGIHEAQLRNIGVSNSSDGGGSSSNACVGMPAFCMVTLSAAAILGLQASCVRHVPAVRFDISSSAIQSVPPALVAVISAEQFRHITLGSIELLTAAQLAQINLQVCANMNNMRMNMLEDGAVAAQDPPPCSGFTAACVEALPPASLDSVHGSCLSHMQPSVLASLTGNQSRALPVDQLSWLSPGVASALSSSFCAGLTGVALDWMATPRGLRPLSGASQDCLAAFTDDACRHSASGTWLRLFDTPANATRLTALTAGCVSAFSCHTWATLQFEELYYVRTALNSAGSAVLSSRCADPLPPSPDRPDWPLIFGLIGGSLLLVVIVMVVVVLRRRKRMQQHMHTHLLAQQSQAAYRSAA
jgi:hypothetical protein